MRVEDSPHSVLGLRPGAPRAEVDLAYRRLIKIHHPDRNGGDGRRAAEINRAYTAIRSGQPVAPPARRVPVPVYARRRPVRRRPFWLMVLAVSVGAGILAAQDGADLVAGTLPAVAIDWPVPESRATLQPISPPFGDFDEPLHDSVIEAAIGHAADFHLLGDVEGAQAFSRDCDERLRAEPSLVLFDSCTAFDESAATLAAVGAGLHGGAFSDSAVTSREMTAARALSNDMFGADSRVNQIRSKVELAILPKLDAAAGLPPG